MVLECPDGSFGRILSVDVRRYQLEAAPIGSDGMLEHRTNIVVEDVQCRGGVVLCQSCVDILISCDAVGVMFGRERPDEDGVGRAMDGDHDVLIATP